MDEQNFPHVHADQPLHMALERMGTAQTGVLPVVSRADMHELEGIVTLPGVLKLYGLAPVVGQGNSA